MSRQRKPAAVLRLLRGEDLELVLRCYGGHTEGMAAVCRIGRLARSGVYRFIATRLRRPQHARTARANWADVRCGVDDRNSRRASARIQRF
jgi:hypothetical protein